MRKHIHIFALAALVLFSCSKEKGGQEVQAGSNVLSIKATVGATKSAAPLELKSAFESGDQISLYAWMGSATAVPEKKIVDGVVNTFDGAVWTPETKMLWSYVKEKHYFLGVYPTKKITNFTADEYFLGPDLLVATELDGIAFKENPDPVSLSFTHLMAKLDVNLRFRNQWEEIPTVNALKLSAKREFTVNYLTKAVTPIGSVVNVPLTEITAVSGHHRSFTGLQVPQEGVNTLTISIGDDDFVYQGPIALESGKITTLNLYVGKDKIELGAVTVSDWEDNAPIEGGEAEVTETT